VDTLTRLAGVFSPSWDTSSFILGDSGSRKIIPPPEDAPSAPAAGGDGYYQTIAVPFASTTLTAAAHLGRPHCALVTANVVRGEAKLVLVRNADMTAPDSVGQWPECGAPLTLKELRLSSFVARCASPVSPECDETVDRTRGRRTYPSGLSRQRYLLQHRKSRALDQLVHRTTWRGPQPTGDAARPCHIKSLPHALPPASCFRSQIDGLRDRLRV